VIAFVGANVLPMDRDRVLENHTVIIRNGVIAEITPAARAKVPEGALRIDAKGKYLMPGLAEMHGHLPSANQGEQQAQNVLTLFVANGVTTVRGMQGSANQPALRDRIAKGELLGPTLYLGAPALSGQSVPDPDTARRLVREYKQAGFDLLKVHEGLSRETYDAIVATAKEVGIPFGGHVADQVGLLHALKSGQSSIEHLDGYVEALEADDSPIKNANAATRAQQLIKYIDERKIPAVVAATKQANSWVTPTMALWQTFFGRETVESFRQRPELKYMPPQAVNQWVQQKTNQLNQQQDPKPGTKLLALRDRLLKALNDGGVNVMLGSDAPQVFSVPGFSLARETAAMLKVGMTPFQILQSGTRNPAINLNKASEFGTVEAGKRADLILLNANPLKDVANVWQRAGVMVRGRWLPESEIKALLEKIAASYTQ
jgi:imidazolonepropionase-like amidohydrolase